jgi:hypothetical protein
MAEEILKEMYDIFDCCEWNIGITMQEKCHRLNAFADSMMPELVAYNELWDEFFAFYDSRMVVLENGDEIPEYEDEDYDVLQDFRGRVMLIRDRMIQHRTNCWQQFAPMFGAFRSWIMVLEIANLRRHGNARRNLVAFADSAYQSGAMPACLNELMLIDIAEYIDLDTPFDVFDYDFRALPFDMEDDPDDYEADADPMMDDISGVGDLLAWIRQQLAVF